MRAEGLELLGVLEELLDLVQLLHGFFHAGHVLEADLRSVGVIRLARLLPKLITFEPPPCIWFIRKIQKPIRSKNGRNEISSEVSEKPPCPSSRS